MRKFIDAMKFAFFGLKRRNLPVLFNSSQNALSHFATTTNDLKKGVVKNLDFKMLKHDEDMYLSLPEEIIPTEPCEDPKSAVQEL